MTDYERVIGLLNSLGLECEAKTGDYNPLYLPEKMYTEKRMMITCKERTNKVDAYGGFFFRFIFDLSGRFECVQIGEGLFNNVVR